MKVTIDTKNKSIEVLEDVDAIELLKLIERIFEDPKGVKIKQAREGKEIVKVVEVIKEPHVKQWPHFPTPSTPFWYHNPTFDDLRVTCDNTYLTNEGALNNKVTVKALTLVDL